MGSVIMWSMVGIAITAIVLLFTSIFTIKEKHVGVIQRWGKFHRMAPAGLGFKVPIMDTVAKKISLLIEAAEVTVDSKTKNNVFVALGITVQYKVLPEKVWEAFYSLADPLGQIEALVQNVVRAHVPAMELDKVFESKDSIANQVREELSTSMASYGYQIVSVQVVDINLPPEVRNSMNAVYASQRDQEAAKAKGEANKVMVIAAAEAEAKSKELQGQGIAAQRAAIIDGMKKSITDFQSGVNGVDANHVMAIMLLTQHLDTMAHLGRDGHAKVIFVNPGPGGLTDLQTQMQAALEAGGDLSVKGTPRSAQAA